MTAGALTAGGLIVSAAIVAPAAGATSVNNVGFCIDGVPAPGGCQAGGGGTTSVAGGSTPSTDYFEFVATSGLTSSDTVTLAGPAGSQFDPAGEYGLDNVTAGTDQCSSTGATVTNSGATLTLDVPSACTASAGQTYAIGLYAGALTMPSTGASCDQWEVSTSQDSTPFPTNCITIQGVPGAPTSPRVLPQDHNLSVSWTAPSNTGGSPLTGYRVYCAQGSPPPTTVTPTATVAYPTERVVVTHLQNGTTYGCVVTAVNALGQSVASATVTSIPGTPSPPRDVDGRNFVGAVGVSWMAPRTDGGFPVLVYGVYCSTTNPPSTSGSPSVIVSATTSPLAAKITHLPVGQTYYCVVAADNVNGLSAPAAEVVTHSATVPGAPTAPSATPTGPNTVVVQWTPPLHDGGDPVVVYFVHCSTTNPPPLTGSDVCGGANAPATGADVTVPLVGVPYYFDVVAVNAMGGSKPSPVVSATTP